MTIDPIAQALHLRVCRGDVLTAGEQTRLQQWYAKMDEEEAEMFARNARPMRDLQPLQKELDDLLAEIASTAQKIRSQEAVNEKLLQENERLKALIVQKSARQTA